MARHADDAYDKDFDSWRHLVALAFAQLTGADSLRAIETAFNAQSNHHYHLGCGRFARSTLGDANHVLQTGKVVLHDEAAKLIESANCIANSMS